jgi:nitrate/nitrite transporter NarK
MAETISEKKKLNAYFYLVIIILNFMVCGLCQYKIQPILTSLMSAMNVDAARAGLLLSIGGVLSIFITIPLGILMNSIGPRKMGIFGIIVVLIGSLVGTFSTESFGWMMVSQVIIGAGSAAISILGPYVIACLFVPSMRGRANGWYITAGTISQLIMYNVVPRIVTATTLSPAWWLTNIFAAVMLIVWMLTITDTVAPPLGKDAGQPAGLLTVLGALKDAKTLQLAIGGGFFMMSAIGILYFTPAYLVSARGYTEAAAGSLVSVCALVGAVASFLGGTLSDILKTRKWIYFAAIAWMAVSRILIAVLPSGMALNLVIWGQGLPSIGMGLLYTVAGEVLEPRKVGVGISAINTLIAVGSFFAATLFGVFVTTFGYTTTFLIYAAITCVGFVGVCTIKGVK